MIFISVPPQLSAQHSSVSCVEAMSGLRMLSEDLRHGHEDHGIVVRIRSRRQRKLLGVDIDRWCYTTSIQTEPARVLRDCTRCAASSSAGGYLNVCGSSSSANWSSEKEKPKPKACHLASKACVAPSMIQTKRRGDSMRPCPPPSQRTIQVFVIFPDC